MGIVVAIGGVNKEIGDIKNICKMLLELSKKNIPKILYIPTGNNDHEEYSKYMADFFENNYFCSVDTLWLIKKQINNEEIESKINSADIVFVEGRKSSDFIGNLEQVWCR